MKSFSFTSGRALPRRSFLKTSSVLLALPWLPSMQAAFAGTPVQPKRFLGILNYYSFHAPYLFPRTPGKNYDATPYLDLLSAHRADYTIISGLNHPGVRDGHASDKSFLPGRSIRDRRRFATPSRSIRSPLRRSDGRRATLR
jgi:hypothetical protein